MPRMKCSSKRLGNGVVLVRRQEHILREVDLDAVALADRDGRRNLNEAVKNRGCRLRNARSGPGRECLGAARRNCSAALLDFACAGDDSQGNGSTEDLQGNGC